MHTTTAPYTREEHDRTVLKTSKTWLEELGKEVWSGRDRRSEVVSQSQASMPGIELPSEER